MCSSIDCCFDANMASEKEELTELSAYDGISRNGETPSYSASDVLSRYGWVSPRCTRQMWYLGISGVTSYLIVVLNAYALFLYFENQNNSIS